MRLTPAKITKGKILGFLLFFSTEAFGLPQVLKRDPTAASGRCLIPAVTTLEQARSVLSRYKIQTHEAKDVEKIALARGLAQAEALFGKRFRFAGVVRFSFAERKGFSRYEGYDQKEGVHQIRMNRCDSKGKNCAPNNVAHLLHELGHKIGNSQFVRGETFYEAYSRLAGKCRPTAYSLTNRNEEFAEVFAAFLTHPELLSAGNSDCQRAYEFFAQDVFVANGRLASCESGARRALMARLGNGLGGEVRVAERSGRSERIDRRSRMHSAPAAKPSPQQVSTPPVSRRIAEAPVWDDDVAPMPWAAAQIRREQARAFNPWVYSQAPVDPDEETLGESESDGEQNPYRERDRQQMSWLWSR